MEKGEGKGKYTGANKWRSARWRERRGRKWKVEEVQRRRARQHRGEGRGRGSWESGRKEGVRRKKGQGGWGKVDRAGGREKGTEKDAG